MFYKEFTVFCLFVLYFAIYNADITIKFAINSKKEDKKDGKERYMQDSDGCV